MDSPSSLLLSSFGDKSNNTDRVINQQLQKLSLYSPASDSIDLGYHTLDNAHPYRSSSSPCSSQHHHQQQQQQQQQQRKKNQNVGILQLDDDILLKIFNCLSPKERCKLSQTCRKLWEIAWHPSLWQEVEIKSQNPKNSLKTIAKYGCHSYIKKLIIESSTDFTAIFLSLPFTSLSSLILRNSRKLTDSNVTIILDNCHNLKELDLTGCASVTRAYSHASTTILESLDLSDCHCVDDSGLVITLSRMPNLEFLYLRRCSKITDASLVSIASYCSSMRQLSVSDCNKITDFGIRELAAKLGPSLRYLSVGKCDRVSDAGFLVVARYCYKLRYLNARGCEALGDTATIALSRGCPRLRALDLGKCDIGDLTLDALSTGCPNLKKLSLCGCDRITDAGLEALAYYIRGLRQLNIGECSRITKIGYKAVKSYCRRCVIEHTNPGFSS